MLAAPPSRCFVAAAGCARHFGTTLGIGMGIAITIGSEFEVDLEATALILAATRHRSRAGQRLRPRYRFRCRRGARSPRAVEQVRALSSSCGCRLNCGNTMKCKCPGCGSEAEFAGNPLRPFCSEKCKLLDLGSWLSGTYSVPAADGEAEEEKSESPNDSGEP